MAKDYDISDNEIRIIGDGISEKYCAKFNANCKHFNASGLCKYNKSCGDQRKATSMDDVDNMYRLAMRRDQLQILKLLQEMHKTI